MKKAKEATDLEKKAKEAFVDDDFEFAVNLYTQALNMDPSNVDLYADQAQANIKIDRFPGKKNHAFPQFLDFLFLLDLFVMVSDQIKIVHCMNVTFCWVGYHFN